MQNPWMTNFIDIGGQPVTFQLPTTLLKPKLVELHDEAHFVSDCLLAAAHSPLGALIRHVGQRNAKHVALTSASCTLEFNGKLNHAQARNLLAENTGILNNHLLETFFKNLQTATTPQPKQIIMDDFKRQLNKRFAERFTQSTGHGYATLPEPLGDVREAWQFNYRDTRLLIPGRALRHRVVLESAFGGNNVAGLHFGPRIEPLAEAAARVRAQAGRQRAANGGAQPA